MLPKDLNDVAQVPRAGAGCLRVPKVGVAMLTQHLIDRFPWKNHRLPQHDKHARQRLGRYAPRNQRLNACHTMCGLPFVTFHLALRETIVHNFAVRLCMATSHSNPFADDAARCMTRAWDATNADRQWKDPSRRSTALGMIADALLAHHAEIIALASAETALTTDELTPEFARMVRTLRLFASRVASDTWRRLAWSPPEPDPANAIGPNHDLRSFLVPRRGVAVVFGASNFPLAYGVCGGDTASALAAGLPVVIKEHTAHRATGRRIATIVRDALTHAGLSPDLLGYAREPDDETLETAPGDSQFDVARTLVTHELAAAVGFTGSFAGGMAIDALARARPKEIGGPIPVFAEMGSTNPVFVSRAALLARSDSIARDIAASLLARHGQQCTCPGLILIESDILLPALAKDHEHKTDPIADAFEQTLAHAVQHAPTRPMLSPRVREAYVKQVNTIAGYMPEVEVLAMGAIDPPSPQSPGSPRADHARLAPAMLLRTDIDELRTLRFLSEEAFGPSTVIARYTSSRADMLEDLFTTIQGHLVACVYAEPEELRDASSLTRALLERLIDVAGRVVLNGVPTGVRVCDAMVHSGPFPACNAPETTAVGPRAIERWCRLVCLQNWPDELVKGLDQHPTP